MRSVRFQPGPGQESVWDYPRPPVLRPDRRLVRVRFAGVTIAETRSAIRVLETSHPPTFYLPPGDVQTDCLVRSARSSCCEFKGRALYWSLELDGFRSDNAAWSYPDPAPAFAALRDYLAFYSDRVEACFVGGERVRSQEGDFYGGWITSEIVGPFKGGRGTLGW